MESAASDATHGSEDLSAAAHAPSTSTETASSATQPAATTTPKLSNAELKKQAKAEKAARRAQTVSKKAGASSSQDSKANEATLAAAEGARPKHDLVRNVREQHRRTGSNAADTRHLAIRGISAAGVTATEAPKVEDKTVDLFRHLHKARTTSIARANKDVHPAVLALGMQMSSYTICGSCARLVATLQALKQVQSYDYTYKLS